MPAPPYPPPLSPIPTPLGGPPGPKGPPRGGMPRPPLPGGPPLIIPPPPRSAPLKMKFFKVMKMAILPQSIPEIYTKENERRAMELGVW